MMEALKIEPTEFTPGIRYNPAKLVFELWGVSRPENVLGFYQKPIEWLREFEKETLTHLDSKYKVNKLHLIFKMVYFNSASAKSILQMLEIWQRFAKNGVELAIDWYFDEGDDQMLEDGQDLSEAIDLPFNFISVS